MKLVVNQAYLERFVSLDDAFRGIDQDVEQFGLGDEIELIRSDDPKGLYVDVLAYICAKSAERGCVLRPKSKNDEWRIRAVLGYDNIEGDMESGFRFKNSSKVTKKTKNI
ncbi:MAG: hypothetical protein ABIJ21_07115 [Nanoarchaeota archaeon]